jgi:hypothetical protein
VGVEIVIDTIATGWDKVVGLFRSDDSVRIATRNGVSFDIPGITIWIENPSDLTPPEGYEYPVLIRDYADRMFGDQRSESLVYQRVRRWRNGDAAAIDQAQGDR